MSGIKRASDAAIVVAAIIIIVSGSGSAQITPAPIPYTLPSKARRFECDSLHSATRKSSRRFNETALRSVPFPGQDPFGACEDTKVGVLFFGDLSNGMIYRFNKDLSPDETKPSIPGVEGVQAGLAYDPVGDSLWVLDGLQRTIREVDKNGGGPTGRTLGLDPEHSSVPGPMTIDPTNSDYLWYEDLGTDTLVEIRISTGTLTGRIMQNPSGSPAFGNGISWAPGGSLDVTSSSESPAALQIWTGNPLRSMCDHSLEFLPTSDIAAETGDPFVNEFQYSIDPAAPGGGTAEVWYVVGNATNTIYEVGPIGPRPSNIRRFGAGNVGIGHFLDGVFPRVGFDGIPVGPGSLPAGWTTSSPTTNGDWGAHGFARANSAGQANFSSALSVVKDDYLDTPLLSLPAANFCGKIELRFWHTFDLEAGFDGVVLEASTDGGKTFDSIAPLVIKNAPTARISSDFGSPIAGRLAWTGGAIGEMEEVRVDLTPLAGRDVKIRWRHADDSSNAGVGYYLDSVSVGTTSGVGLTNVLFVNRSSATSTEHFDSIPSGVGSVPANSAPTSMVSSGTESVKDDYLRTPLLDLRGSAEINFFHWFELENGFDGGIVELSTDGGANFAHDLGLDAAQNGYTGVIATNSMSPISGRAAWTGSSVSWKRVRLAVPPDLQVPNAVIRFRLACDDAVGSTGWFIDDFSIGGNDGTGGNERVVVTAHDQPIAVDLVTAPCGPASSRYVLWIWTGVSIDPHDQVARGTNLGCAVNATPFNGPAPSNALRCLSGGLPSNVCGLDWIRFSAPARGPWSLRRAQGYPARTITLQGIIEDAAASNDGGLLYSMTNAVQIDVR
ncbi:MAG: hypothetical protein HYR85_06495 [Planctomycetes bacterium]|nr:hypothetical protein [Planctomycetota bacterium]